MSVDLLLGLQWGDEGKGKIVDVLTESYDIIARFQGGPNAGHTLEFEGIKHVLHTIPSGIFHSTAINLIGNGVIILLFFKELEKLSPYNNDFRQIIYIKNPSDSSYPPIIGCRFEASRKGKKISTEELVQPKTKPEEMDACGDILTKGGKMAIDIDPSTKM